MWIERTTYITAYRFPGILKWFEVKSVSVEEISPLMNAIETMEIANEKLSNLVQQQACDRSLSINPLSMMLSGIVDPAVMGGFSNYEKAFFTDTYIQEHPGDHERIEVLKHLTALQVNLSTIFGEIPFFLPLPDKCVHMSSFISIPRSLSWKMEFASTGRRRRSS
ncbi:Dedicator of cytokinesis protein 5 [Xenoophorus captivus]|uniref:Dedicator of cytokinesis protein 5 n=1 Tax=Xenoophorus captivus TaxID=1517983 RepID=A0ABV0RBH1_9TELE